MTTFKRLLSLFLLAFLLLGWSSPVPAADLTITAASVAPSTGAQTVNGTAGATITQGQPVYLDSTTSTYKLSDNNLSGAKSCSGIALNAASSGQPLTIQTGGAINLGATLTVGKIYVVSATAGAIAPSADLATGNDVIILGVATSSSIMQMQIFAPGATVP